MNSFFCDLHACLLIDGLLHAARYQKMLSSRSHHLLLFLSLLQDILLGALVYIIVMFCMRAVRLALLMLSTGIVATHSFFQPTL